MEAQDVMVRDVVTVRPDTSIGDAIKLLSEHDVSALPVVDQDRKLIGILSEADLLDRGEFGHSRPWWVEALLPGSELAGRFVKSHGQRVDEVMTTDVVTAEEGSSLSDIAALLERHRIKRVPIVRDEMLVGVVSRSNLIQALALSKPAMAAMDTDRLIRMQVLERLGEQDWTDFGSRNIIVSDGVVHIWGLVGSEPERRALTALAEEVPGVARVSDEMIPAY